MNAVLKGLPHKLDRARKMLETSKEKYDGKEMYHTFHGGRDHGHLQGKVEAFEAVEDILAENIATMRADCAWGDGPDVILLLAGLDIDLTAKEAKTLAGMLLNAAAQADDLDSIAQQHDDAMEEGE